jgi:ABC-type amino acid transport substrate-binding protein
MSRRSYTQGLAIGAVLVMAGACVSRAGPDTARTAAGAVTEVEAGAAASPVAGTSFRETQRTGRGQITFFYVPASGFAYRDDTGTLTGVTVELLRDFARYAADTHGVELEAVWREEVRWSDFYRHVRNSEGGVFGVGNVTITEARRDELDFSPPYLHNIAVLVTHERVPELHSMADIGHAFRSLTALPFPGTLHEARLDAIRERYLPGLPTRPVESNDEIVALLASDGGYFGYLDVYNYHRARQAGLPLRRHRVGDDASEAFGVILPRSSDWTPVIEAFFRAGGGYTRSARFREHMRNHLGEELAALLAGD